MRRAGDALLQIFRAVVSRDPTSASNLEPLGAEQQEVRVRALPDEVTQQRLHFMHNPPDVASSAIGAAPGGHDDALLQIKRATSSRSAPSRRRASARCPTR